MITHYEGNLLFGVEIGQIFVISGRTLDISSELIINFAASKLEGPSIPLSLGVRFLEDVIARNTYIDGEGWGTEETDDNLNGNSASNPIIPGESFQIYILTGDSKFHISINGYPFCTYEYRLPLEEIRAITIGKDIHAITQVDHRQAFPNPHPLVQYECPIFTFSNDIPKEFVAGHVIIMTAIPYGNPNGAFLIRMTEGEDIEKQALHFTPRFNEKVVVRNHTTGKDIFGREERNDGFPFKIDQQFKLAIAFTETCFKFAVNGKKFTEFNYRSPNVLPKINGIKISTRCGLNVEVTGVDHLHMGVPDCNGFEEHSHPDVILL